VPAAAESPGWLDDEQQDCWRAFNEAMAKLRWAMEDQLQRDAGISFVEYHALARLSENPGRTMRMSELAEVTHASSHRT
jgi:DNA-binding MarR family transcriptional regulator